jgi:tetratricopeptide (TPR) repeat protein
VDRTSLEKRIAKALDEDRYQHALDLAKTLWRIDPQAAHRDLLVRAALGRAEQLLANRYPRDAAAVLSGVAAWLDSSEWKERAAMVLARAGEFTQAQALAKELPQSPLSQRILLQMADSAVRGRTTPSAGVPADFLIHRDLIVKAFAQVHAGQDELARATLQAIGLTSPFLDWKVLLRGFIAYYQQDDAKALENWQRLNAEGLPARLAAPFRQLIDPAFRQLQPPETRAALQAAVDRIQSSGLVPKLRNLQMLLADERHLAQAFRQAEALLPALKTEARDLAPRLASCFFWAIFDHGYPEDIGRFQRAFGAPADDPELFRLQALALEHRQQYEDAQELWQKYEQNLAKRASALPPGQAERMRALIWRHLGENAARARLSSNAPNFPFGFDLRPAPADLDAERCFQRSLELAPDLLESHLALFIYYLDNNKPKALQAALRLLKQFPDHVPTLTKVGDLSLHEQNYADAVLHFTRAAQANPLDAKLRSRLSVAHAGCGDAAAEAGHFEKARQAFQAALALREGPDRFTILCQWSACEFLAQNAARAEELLEQARSEHGHPLAIAFAMLVHAIRFKLGKNLKARFDADFKTMLAQAPDAASAAALAAHAAALKEAGVKYFGQKTHEKKVLTYLEKAQAAEFTEAQLQRICQALQDLQSVKLLQSYFARGQRLYPANPQFYLAEIDYHLSLPPYRAPVWATRKLLDKVRELASTKPPGERQALLKQMQECEDALHAVDPFGDFFRSGGFGGFDDSDDFYDDEEEYVDDYWDNE